MNSDSLGDIDLSRVLAPDPGRSKDSQQPSNNARPQSKDSRESTERVRPDSKDSRRKLARVRPDYKKSQSPVEYPPESAKSDESLEDGYFGHNLAALDSAFVSNPFAKERDSTNSRSGSTRPVVKRKQGLDSVESKLQRWVSDNSTRSMDPFADVTSLLDENLDQWEIPGEGTKAEEHYQQSAHAGDRQRLNSRFGDSTQVQRLPNRGRVATAPSLPVTSVQAETQSREVIEKALRHRVHQLESQLRKFMKDWEIERDRAAKAQKDKDASICKLALKLNTQMAKDEKIFELEGTLFELEGKLSACAKNETRVSELEEQLKAQGDKDAKILDLEEKLQTLKAKDLRIGELEEIVKVLGQKDAQISELKEKLRRQGKKDARIFELEEQLEAQKERDATIFELKEKQEEKDVKISELEERLEAQLEAQLVAQEQNEIQIQEVEEQKDAKIRDLEAQLRMQKVELSKVSKLEERLKEQGNKDTMIFMLEERLRLQANKDSKISQLEEKLKFLELSNQQLLLLEASTRKSQIQKATIHIDTTVSEAQVENSPRRRRFTTETSKSLLLRSGSVASTIGRSSNRNESIKTPTSRNFTDNGRESGSPILNVRIRSGITGGSLHPALADVNNALSRKEMREVAPLMRKTSRRHWPEVKIDTRKRFSNDSGYGSPEPETPRTSVSVA